MTIPFYGVFDRNRRTGVSGHNALPVADQVAVVGSIGRRLAWLGYRLCGNTVAGRRSRQHAGRFLSATALFAGLLL